MSDKLRVLHVVPYFPPDRIGGIGEVAAHLHRGLLDLGHDSHVLTRGTSRDDPRVHRIAQSAGGFMLRCGLQRQLLNECDVVHCHHGEAIGFLLTNRFSRCVPALMTLHCSCAGIGRSHRPYTLSGRKFGRDSKAFQQRCLIAPVRHALDVVATRSCAAVNFISRHGAIDYLGPKAGATAEVVYYGLPELDDADEMNVEQVDLLYAGASNHRKRVYALPFILARVRETLPNARLRIIGFRLEDEPKLVELLRELNVFDAVVCEGPKRSDQLAPYYRAAKVLLVPSAHEGLPMVIIEALRCGTPCVATNVSGHPEIIKQGENGFLVDIDRPDQMADRIVEILSNANLQRAMSAAAPGIVRERFEINRELDEYLRLYRSMIASTLNS